MLYAKNVATGGWFAVFLIGETNKVFSSSFYSHLLAFVVCLLLLKYV